MPKVRWFANQREALGLEAALYAFMAVGELLTPFLALTLFLNRSMILCLLLSLTLTLSRSLLQGACDEVVQWGFDETTLDGTSCFNQWCLVRTGWPCCVHKFPPSPPSLFPLHFSFFFQFIINFRSYPRTRALHCHRGVCRHPPMFNGGRNRCTHSENLG
jgi:hypothetical protein